MPKSLRILVVDDHEKVRRGICTLLRADPDLEVTCEAADGIQAVTNAEQLQTRLSPAHPDANKVSFAELENRIRNRAYQLYEYLGGAYADGHT
jgi:DNA-binding NarL/FixJ family response regulator